MWGKTTLWGVEGESPFGPERGIVKIVRGLMHMRATPIG